jgi:hypothetical protein
MIKHGKNKGTILWKKKTLHWLKTWNMLNGRKYLL